MRIIAKKYNLISTMRNPFGDFVVNFESSEVEAEETIEEQCWILID